MKFIVIVEDKKEELQMAILAIKTKLGIPADVAGLPGIDIEDLSVFKMGFEILAGVETTLVFAQDLHGGEEAMKFAKRMSETKGYANDGIFILTDLMFPLHNGGVVEQANGISVVLDAVEAGFPVTICSDTDHHEVRFLPKLCRSLSVLHPDAKINLVLDSKNWDKAIDLLLAHADPV